MLENLKARARALKTETIATYIAARNPRTPWLARVIVFLVVAYALSPIDLIPDFVPVLGYLDDLIIVPAGIALALRLIPKDVMAQARQAAADLPADSRAGRIGAVIIVALWILAIILCGLFVRRLIWKPAAP